MYDPPGYLWAIIIAGITAIPAATSVVLYGGAVRAGLGRRRAALLAGGAATVLGGWFTASAVIAAHGWYHARLGHGVPWLPVAAAGFLGLLLALRRIPVVARALAAPGTVSRLELPHSFRVAEGTAFVAIMALGHLPALFALPAGLGDIAAGIAAPLVALRLAQGTGRRAALWFTAFGMTDLVNALTLGALTGFALINVTPVRRADQRAAPRADPDSCRAAAVRPAHHVCVRAGKGSANTEAGHRPAHCRREIEEKRIQLEIDALKEAAAWPGADRRTPLMLASRLMVAELCHEGHPPAQLYAGRGPGQRKGNAMNTRSPYPDVLGRDPASDRRSAASARGV